MVDFSKLSRPKSVAAPTNPIEIFKKTPNLGNAPNDLWKGQAEALEAWHADRQRDDNLVILNTGAGKSIVGILIAQSLHNEAVGPVVYACSTIDLVNQTARECERIGIPYTTRVAQSFSDDLFETGKAFCITTYQALFNAKTTFRNDKRPAAVIFDDAHVAERLVRDSMTVTVQRSKFEDLYGDLVRIVAPEFDSIGKLANLKLVLEDVGLTSVTLCPPITAHNRSAEIIAAFKKHDYAKHPELLFPMLHLFEHIGYCAILISASSIEIAPPFVPTSRFEFLGKGTRRVYLSATLDYETDFIRAFGNRKPNRIEPDNDAGNGERLVLLASGFSKPDDPKTIASSLAQSSKVLVAVPSYPKAKRWSDIVVPPEPSEFSVKLDAFRQSKAGLFCLVSRIDGIDLPQDTCRIMVVDGAPSGASLLERYQFESLGLTNLFSTKLASRVTQLFGRINRGRSDYGAFLVFGKDLNNWLKNDRNKALLPELLRKQVILGQSMQDDLGTMDLKAITDVVGGLLGRDVGWLDFYRDTIDGLEVSTEVIERVKEREEKLSEGAYAESIFMSKLWEGDVAGARTALIDTLNDVAVVDAKVAGWYSLWLGMTFQIEGDTQSQDMHYQRARSRLNKWINIPHRTQFKVGTRDVEPVSSIHGKLLAMNEQGAQALGDYVARLEAQCATLLDSSKTFRQHEEAVRMIGEILGYEASRPDNELGLGPDVIWADETAKYTIAFELKTKKEAPAEYNKTEVGQCLNHVEWIEQNLDGNGCDGLLIVGPDGTCKSDASPSPALHFSTPKVVTDLVREFAAKVDGSRGRSTEERTAVLDDLAQQAEWQPKAWFARLRQKLLSQMQT